MISVVSMISKSSRTVLGFNADVFMVFLLRSGSARKVSTSSRSLSSMSKPKVPENVEIPEKVLDKEIDITAAMVEFVSII